MNIKLYFSISYQKFMRKSCRKIAGFTKKENTNERLLSSRFYYSPLFRVCPSRAFNQRGYTKDAYQLFAMINNLLFDKQTTF